MRVWNGPGPAANKSDDRAMDITLDANPDPIGWRVWLTGHVRDPDGVGYDVATISYIVWPFEQSPNPNEELTPYLPTTTEKGVAVTANVRDVYVTASIQADNTDLPQILTFKIESFGAYPNTYYDFDWMRLFGMAISDIPSAIIAPTRADESVSVFVFGRSFLLPTSYDQVGVHYTEPP